MRTERYMVIRVLSEVALYSIRNGETLESVWMRNAMIAKHFGLGNQDIADIERAVNEAQTFQWPCTSNV